MQALLNQVPGPQFINNHEVGDGLNTAGYRFNQRDNETRDNVTGKIDYNISTRHAISGSYLWNRDNSDRPDLENDYSAIPKVYNPDARQFPGASWRWTPTARLTNEVRAGFNLTYGYFLTTQQFGQYYLTGMTYSDPVNEFQPQGRNTNTYALSDDAAYQRGRHYIQFGFHGQDVRVRSYDASGVVPSYSLAMGAGPAGAHAQQPARHQQHRPGQRQRAAGHAGRLSSIATARPSTSPAAPRATFPARPSCATSCSTTTISTCRTNGRWRRASPSRWGCAGNCPGVADERDSLELLPVLQGTAVQTLLSNATLNFAGGSVGRPWYHRALEGFRPQHRLRLGRLRRRQDGVPRRLFHQLRERPGDLIAPENMLEANGGLQGIAAATGLSGRVATGLPAISLPTLPGSADRRRQLRQQSFQRRGHGRSEPEPAARAAVFHRHPARFQGHGLRGALRGQSRGGRLPGLRFQPGADQCRTASWPTSCARRTTASWRWRQNGVFNPTTTPASPAASRSPYSRSSRARSF